MLKIKKRGIKQYLYLVKKEYIRDKRTTRKKTKHKGDGTANLERWKYTKEGPWEYVGKITPREMTKLCSFEDYVKDQSIEFVLFLLEADFSQILNLYVDYLLCLYNIPREEYENKNNVYPIDGGFLCRKTMEEIHNYFQETKYEVNSFRHKWNFGEKCGQAGMTNYRVFIALYNKFLISEGVEGFLKEDIEEVPTERKVVNMDELRAFMRGEEIKPNTNYEDDYNLKNI